MRLKGAVGAAKSKETLGLREIRRSQGRHRLTVRMGNPPATRAECLQVARPCPFVACRYHVFLDAKENGNLRFPHGSDSSILADMVDTCALDVAAEGTRTLDECADLLGLSRERVRQIEEEAFVKLKAEMDRRGIEWQAGDTAEIDANVGKPDITLDGTAAEQHEEDLWRKEIWNLVTPTKP